MQNDDQDDVMCDTECS